MKFNLNKTEFEALPEDLKKEYSLEGEAATLKIEGEGAPSLEAITRLEDKLRIEKEHRTKAEKSRDAAESSAEKLREDLGKASGKEEITRLNEAHQKELEKIRSEREAEKTATKEAGKAQMIKETAEKFASENFTIPKLMVGPFSQRLSIEEIDGQSVVRVKDAEGKASALSLDELKREFLDNKEFSGIIRSNAGSGGGATPGAGGGAPGKKISEMTAIEEAKFERENPEAYQVALKSENPQS
jgi:hypothetical protein